MADLYSDVATLRTALTEASELLPPSLSADISQLLDRVDRRLGHLGDSVVVALAGGTGSGKSSLLNAIAGEEVVEAGVLRPTTDHPVAWLPRAAEPGLLQLLADMDVTDLRPHDRPDTLAILDLPDIDSVQTAHRAMVDDLVPKVDAVVWVLDPTKYNDALVHQDYLRPLRAYEGQFLVVLNQVDRLGAEERRDVVADLRATLHRSGLPELPVVVVAADPEDGDPVGVDVLLARIHDRFQHKQAAQDKLRVDIDEITARLRTLAGADTDLPDRDAPFEQAASLIARGVVDDPEIGRAGDIGAARAARVAAGPIGAAVGALRNSVVGRGLGLAQDHLLEARLLPTASRPMARIGPAVLLQDWLTDVALAVGTPLDRRVRTTVGDLDGVVHAATSEARAQIDPDLAVPRRAWWVLAGLLRTLAVIAAVGAGLAVWSDPGLLAPGRLPVPAIALAVAVVVWIVLGRLARSSGRLAGEAVAAQHRDHLERIARESLDFHLGRPVDDVLIGRARLRRLLDDVGTTPDPATS